MTWFCSIVQWFHQNHKRSIRGDKSSALPFFDQAVITESRSDKVISEDGFDGAAESRAEDVGVDVIGQTLEELMSESGFREKAIVKISATHGTTTADFQLGKTHLRKRGGEGGEVGWVLGWFGW